MENRINNISIVDKVGGIIKNIPLVRMCVKKSTILWGGLSISLLSPKLFTLH